MNLKNFFSKFLSLLRVRTMIAGLEVSDADLKFAYLNGNSLETSVLRLPPGIIESGEIKNYEMLVGAFKKFRELLPADFRRKKVTDIVVTLNSIHIYTQVFSLPLIENDGLQEAIKLNIRMVSPFDLSQAYAGWQLINQNKSELKVEVLSAFAQKNFIDQLRNALIEAGFFPIAVESGALSLARLIRERGVDFKADKPVLVMSVDDKGLRFMIIRLGQLHFEYFQSWKDIQGDEKEISWENFDAAIRRNLHQVLNFYGSHWQEPLTEMVVASSSFVEEILKTVRENFSIEAKELRLNFDQPVSREWYEVAGSAIRGTIKRADDKDVNLFGITVQEEFRQQQIIEFLKFWQVLVPASLSVMLIAMLGCLMFFYKIGESTEAEGASFSISGKQMDEIASLSSQIKDFNSSIRILSDFEKSTKPKTSVLGEIMPIVNRNNIAIDRLYYQQEGEPLILSGQTDSQENILNFKRQLADDIYFNSVNLNLSDVKPNTLGFSFTLNFRVK